MKFFRDQLLFVGFIALVWTSTALAEFSYGPFTLSAFGTLSGSWLDDDHARYIIPPQASGVGLNRTIDMGLDSRLGTQLNYTLSSSTLLTAQSVIERLPAGNFGPRLTQANIRQEIGDNLVVRVGRIQSPSLLASEYRLANFSNPWLRPPSVVYGLFPLTFLDSAEFTYKHDTKLGMLSLNTGYGWVNTPFGIVSSNGVRGATNIHADNIGYANLKLDKGSWHFKLSWLSANSRVNVPDFDQLIEGVAALDPVAAQRLNPVNVRSNTFAVGFSYDSSTWLVMNEWTTSLPNHAYVVNGTYGGYLTVAYHFDRWLPQITLGYLGTINSRVHSSNQYADDIIASAYLAQRSDYSTLAFGLIVFQINNFQVP